MPKNIMDNQVYLNEMGPQSRLKKQPGSLKAWGAPTMDPAKQLQQAQDAVQLEYGQKQRGLEDAQLDSIAQYNRLVDEEKGYGQEADPRLANIYGALQNSLGQNTTANQETYSDAISQIRNWYDQSYQANNQLNQDAMSRITGDAERLGIEAGIPGGTQKMTEDFLFNQGQNRNAQAGRSANLAELAAKIEALDRNRVGAAGREGAQERAMLANEVAQTIGDLGMAHFNEQAKFRNEQAGMAADRGAAERDALQKFQQRDFENLQTARGNSLQEFLARAGLGLQQSEFRQGNFEADRNYNLAEQELGLQRELGFGELELGRDQLAVDAEKARTDTAIRWAELQHDQRRLSTEQAQWEREFAEATSPEAKARAQAELDRIRAETNALNAEATAINYQPGEFGLQQYQEERKVNNTVKSFTRSVLNQAKAKAGESGVLGDPAAEKILALEIVEKSFNNGFMSERDAQIARESIEIYYGGGGSK